MIKCVISSDTSRTSTLATRDSRKQNSANVRSVSGSSNRKGAPKKKSTKSDCENIVKNSQNTIAAWKKRLKCTAKLKKLSRKNSYAKCARTSRLRLKELLKAILKANNISNVKNKSRPSEKSWNLMKKQRQQTLPHNTILNKKRNAMKQKQRRPRQLLTKTVISTAMRKKLKYARK